MVREKSRERGEEIKRTGEGGERESGGRGKDTEREKWERERIIAKGNDGEKKSKKIEKVNSVGVYVVGVFKWEQMERKKSRENSKHWGKGRKRGRERNIDRVSPEKGLHISVIYNGIWYNVMNSN